MSRRCNDKRNRASAKEQTAKPLVWLHVMSGDGLVLVLDEIAQFNTARPFSMFDEKQHHGVPYLTVNARSTLESCSLVCRAWRFPAQRQLLHSIILNKNSSTKDLAAALEREELPIIPRHATLHLPFPRTLAVNTIASITDLQSLVMRSSFTREDRRMDMTPICMAMLDSCLFFANITSFQFHVHNTVSLEGFARFLMAMPCLKTLHLNVASITMIGPEYSRVLRPTFRLQYLELWDKGGGQPFRLYDWLLWSSRDSLETLALYFRSLPDNMAPFMNGFAMVASSLKILRIPHIVEKRPHICGLIARCTSLVEVGLNLAYFRAYPEPITQSLPCTLRRITVGDCFQNELHRSRSPTRYSVVRKVLARSLLPTSLTTIVIDVNDRDLLVAVKSQVKAMARVCLPKGITVWITCPIVERNLTEEVRNHSSPNLAKSKSKPISMGRRLHKNLSRTILAIFGRECEPKNARRFSADFFEKIAKSHRILAKSCEMLNAKCGYAHL